MTNTNETGEATLLKTDDLGRVRTPQARRESLLDEYERSGLSGAKFAALTGIKYNSGSKNIDDLLNFLRELSNEENRDVREHVSEEELVILDILNHVHR